MGGPKRIIELAEDPSQWEGLDRNAHLMHNGRLWIWMPAGCVQCVESSQPKDQTLRAVDDFDVFVCQNHGPLEKVSYVFEQHYTIQLGSRTVTGSRRTEDFLLFAKNQTVEEREALITRILAEAEDHEVEHDPTMGDD